MRGYRSFCFEPGVVKVQSELANELRKAIRTVPDFPKKGIAFKDLTTLWRNGKLNRRVVHLMCAQVKRMRPNLVAGMQARGFIVAAPVASRLGLGFVPVCKHGTLLSPSTCMSYDTEYDSQVLEISDDSISKGDRVVIIDDLLATGGTSEAMMTLIERFGGEVVGLAFVVELTFLNGRRRFQGKDVYSVVTYDDKA